MNVLPLAAQQPVVYEVRGTIVSTDDGKGIPGVNVYLHETKTGTTTDSLGRFSIPNVKKGSYHLHITMLGFAPVDKTIKVDETLSPLRFELQPSYIEIGRVTIESDMLKSGTKEKALNITMADEEYLLNSKPHELDHLDIIFTWGSHQKDVLIKENPELKAKTVPIGNPRFDLLRQEFRVLYEAESREVCSRWGKYMKMKEILSGQKQDIIKDCLTSMLR